MNMQRCSARYQNLQVRTDAQQFSEIWGCRHHLLEVIHQQEEMFVAEEGFHIVHMFLERSLSHKLMFQPKSMCERVDGCSRIGDGSQGDEADPVNEYVEQLGRDL